jgi:hypothetical protein
MIPDGSWLLGFGGLAAGLAALWRSGRSAGGWREDAGRLRAEAEQASQATAAELRKVQELVASLEAGMVRSRECLRDGRLSVSSRSQALQMLRAGAAPEAVASGLGIASSEAKLLARVGRVLAAPVGERG